MGSLSTSSGEIRTQSSVCFERASGLCHSDRAPAEFGRRRAVHSRYPLVVLSVARLVAGIRSYRSTERIAPARPEKTQSH